ncbi:hypothetical protein EV175_000263 [Coemansia sp. RSA 1933]|nr:hypothetical protein EV175_000263 [Coemansia sp. RSA 1933]
MSATAARRPLRFRGDCRRQQQQQMLGFGCLHDINRRRLVHTTQVRRIDDEDDEDSIDLDSIFKLLDTGPSTTTRKPDDPNGAHQQSTSNNDVDIDALLGSIVGSDSSAKTEPSVPYTEMFSNSAKQQGNEKKNDNGSAMHEFERILSDMAMRKETVYKQRNERPAPLFWREQGIGKKDQEFIEDLGPGTLFKQGPRASAFSANKLASDMSLVSPLAKRVGRMSARDAEEKVQAAFLERQKQQQSLMGSAAMRKQVEKRGATNFISGRLGKRDSDLEQVLMSRLAGCTTVPRLTSFVYDEIENCNSAIIRGIPDALASPVVYAETIRRARELGVPQIGFYVFRHCRRFLDTMGKTRVLHANVYEELLVTAWGAMRDPMAAAFVLRDAVTMGVPASASMARYIDQIVMELHSSHAMHDAVVRIGRLKASLSC